MTGAQANTQRETTPLRRDNSLIRPDRAPVPPPDEATRPAFAPPPRQDQPPAVQQPPQAHQPTSWQAPVAQPEPEPQPRRIAPTGWLLRGLGLVAISVLSGLIWLLIKPDTDDEAASPPAEVPRYQFVPIHREEAFQGCQSVSTAKIKSFFQKQECTHLTRALYSTTLPDGTRVLTSLVTVLMPDAATAQQLNDLTTKDGTGNIRDLVDDGRDGTKGMPALDDDAYASGRQESLVVIGDSAYFDKNTPHKDPALLDVTKEALKLGWPQEKTPR
ncbi:hypothetical protein SAMN05216215_1005300 [Saccharopolyspora shandongensis]|uniref:Uncharacterized protein n=1 Tax=Saccharopolyspora shandongensis TaxID=418495 RepID=A0A1H2WW32_9PSEU|nr:hypothetical protein [Saccharopolyspora shandongensis]SDW84775.1 hypothetical protein SAMN05216215_1005300 [Saccharopolyspora shandongensis]